MLLKYFFFLKKKKGINWVVLDKVVVKYGHVTLLEYELVLLNLEFWRLAK